jgi:hypothetical protein
MPLENIPLKTLRERAIELKRQWRKENPGQWTERWYAVELWQLKTCKYCHAENLVWESTKNNKWMLLETFPVEDEPDLRRTSRRRWHKCPVRRAFEQYPEPAAVLH